MVTTQHQQYISTARKANLRLATILQELARKELTATQAFIKIAYQVKLASRAFELLDAGVKMEQEKG